MPGLIGRKIGMTQVFQEDGTVVPVTVLGLGPCPVVQVKTPAHDGYAAVQLAFDEVVERKVSRPVKGHLAKYGVTAHRVLREMRTEQPMEAGAVLDVSLFAVGQKVNVIGTTKGRGFQGVVKRHGYSGGRETHGCKTHNLPGSIGASASPARVVKGKKLPGHMGNARRTISNLTVVQIDAERNLLVVKGAVPGSRNSLVVVHPVTASEQKG